MFFWITKNISVLPLVFFIAAFLIDSFTSLNKGIKNLLYLLTAFSVYPILLGLFLIYLPFAVFGCLLGSKSFVRNYVFGFSMSFIPATLIYLAATYLSLPLNLTLAIVLFYLFPLAAFILLKKESLPFFELNERELMAVIIILGLAIVVGANILSEKNLFIANGVREFSRLQTAVDGLKNYHTFVTYNPAIAQGEATFLWNSPAFYSNISLAAFILGNAKPVLVFNFISFFILFLSTISLFILLSSIAGKDDSALGTLATAAIAATVGLNFFFLQLLESFKQYYAFPMAYLFLAMILENPKTFREFLILAYMSVMIMMIHLAYGSGVNVIALSLLVLVKSYYIKDRTELKDFMAWSLKNKLRIAATAAIFVFLIMFYLLPGVIFKDFFVVLPNDSLSIATDVMNFFREFFQNYARILTFTYPGYPDVNRIDDHKAGFFFSVLGVISLFSLLLAYKIKSIKNFRIFAYGFLINLAILSLITQTISVRVGGFYRTTPPYLLILMGASMLTLILLFRHKIIKIALIAAIFLIFFHAMPYAKQNVTNIHVEQFASGEVYQNEIKFIRELPVDGRIMTYGLFSNAVDFGSSYLTQRYFSRNERIELAVDRTVFEKIHGQPSWGDPDLIMNKSGTELSNYLILGGYKYLFMDARHPISQHVLLEMSPSFAKKIYQNIPKDYFRENSSDFAYPIYQDGPLVILIVNNTNYAEKVELVKNLPDEIYKGKNGYKYQTISNYYHFNTGLGYVNVPSEPQALKFNRISPTKIEIYGDFKDGNFVVFKEEYFSRWKAYMSGAEVPVYANNNDLILIGTTKGDKITLEYSALGVEKVVGSLSLVGFVGLLLVFLLLLKN